MHVFDGEGKVNEMLRNEHQNQQTLIYKYL